MSDREQLLLEALKLIQDYCADGTSTIHPPFVAHIAREAIASYEQGTGEMVYTEEQMWSVIEHFWPMGTQETIRKYMETIATQRSKA